MDKNKLPKHICIIPDGNRRWARGKGLPIKLGHKAGADNIFKTVKWCSEFGVPYLTIFIFSTENWGRDKKEVNDLMSLIRAHKDKNTLNNTGARIKFIGDFEKVDPDIKEAIYKIEEETEKNTKINFCMAFSYGSRNEITNTAKKLAKKVSDGLLSVGDINEKIFAQNLQNPDFPDPDLFIRTGGEKRISNFLLWQIAYSELYFSDVFWPDFGKEELKKAIINFQNRERRYGKNKIENKKKK